MSELLEQPAESEVEVEVPPPSDPETLRLAHAWGEEIMGLSRDLKVETDVCIAALTEVTRQREASDLLAAIRELGESVERLATVKTVPWWRRWAR